MVISFKNHVGDLKDLNDTSFATASRSDLLAMNLARMELLLKEIVGGEAIGWGSSGPLDLDERVVSGARFIMGLSFTWGGWLVDLCMNHLLGCSLAFFHEADSLYVHWLMVSFSLYFYQDRSTAYRVLFVLICAGLQLHGRSFLSF